MNTKQKALMEIDAVERLLKTRCKEGWSKEERAVIEKRGEQLVDFYRIQFKLQVLDRMRAWVYKYGRLVNSQRNILKNYRRV